MGRELEDVVVSDFLDSVIPATPVATTLINPRSLVIYKDMKVGGSAIASWLSLHRNAVWLDCEDGSGGMPGRPVNVIREAPKRKSESDDPIWKGRPMTRVEFCLKLFRELAACDPPRYQFLIVDKVDCFEDWADGWALAAYQNTIIGRDFKGVSMSELPFQGWTLWHDKFKVLWAAAKMAAPHVIFLCSLKTTKSKYGDHTQDAPQGILNATDLDLGTRQRKTAVGDSDAIGILIRKDDGANYLSFRSKERDAFVGSRVQRLEGQTIKLSWLDKDRRLVVDWDALYLPAARNGELSSEQINNKTT